MNSLFRALMDAVRRIFPPAYVGDGLLKHSLRPYAAALRLDVIDVHIRPLVAAFNAVPGVTTIASCHGHNFPWRRQPAYVYFQCPSDFALELCTRISQAEGSSRLSYHWQLDVTHHPPRGPCWYLQATQRSFRRSVLNGDLSRLRSLVDANRDFVATERGVYGRAGN